MAKKKAKTKSDSPTIGPVGVEIVQTMASPGRLKPNPWNFNEMSDFQFAKLRTSVMKYGFVDPVIVYQADTDEEGDYTIIDGEHRWRAAKECQVALVPIVVLKGLQEGDAKALTITLNELGGTPNTERLASLVHNLLAEQVDISALPYDDEELARFDVIGSSSLGEAVDEPADSLGNEDPEEKEPKRPRMDLASLCEFDSMSDDETREFAHLVDELRDHFGAKPPYLHLMKAMRRMIKKAQEKAEAAHA